MLAQSSFSPPAEIAAWLACAAFLIMMANGLFKLSRNVKGPAAHPPSGELDLRVKKVEDEVVRVDRKVDAVSGKVDQLRQDIVTNGETRKNAIEGKLNDVRLELKADITRLQDSMQEQHNEVILAVGELRGKVN